MMWTDDPVRDAYRYSEEREAYLKTRPVCAACGCAILGNVLQTRCRGKRVYFCEECVEDVTRDFEEDF